MSRHALVNDAILEVAKTIPNGHLLSADFWIAVREEQHAFRERPLWSTYESPKKGLRVFQARLRRLPDRLNQAVKDDRAYNIYTQFADSVGDTSDEVKALTADRMKELLKEYTR